MSSIPKLPFDHAFERGMRNRRAALGDAWVDKSIAKANTFNAEFQHFITDYAWHGVWGRPGLDWKTRRVLVLAVTCALGRWDEFEIHLRGSLTPGNAHTLTPDEVREALFQIAIYAGVPAANTGFSKALGILRELGIEPPAHPADEAWHSGEGRPAFTTSRPKLFATLREPRHADTAADEGRQTIVLSHALGQDHSMWDAVANQLARHHRVITPDTRGHGRSEIPDGPLSLDDLAADAARVIDELAEGGPVIWVGLSMGGMIGQALALQHPDKVKALVLANTTSQYPEAGRQAVAERIATVQAQGLGAIATATMNRFFSDDFRQRQAAAVARHQRLFEATDPEGYTACSAAIREIDTTARLGEIRVPTLVIAGSEDQGTPRAMLDTIAQGIPGAHLHTLEGAAHLSAAEQPEAFADLVGEFIASL
jgi:3-oxoadipate enol-lactonase